jgi:hypothetical protein
MPSMNLNPVQNSSLPTTDKFLTLGIEIFSASFEGEFNTIIFSTGPNSGHPLRKFEPEKDPRQIIRPTLGQMQPPFAPKKSS